MHAATLQLDSPISPSTVLGSLLLLLVLWPIAALAAHPTRHCVDLYPFSQHFTVLEGCIVTSGTVSCHVDDVSAPSSMHNHTFSFFMHGTGFRLVDSYSPPAALVVTRLDRPRHEPVWIPEGRSEVFDLPLAPYHVSGTGSIKEVQIYSYTQGLYDVWASQAAIFCNHTSVHGWLAGRWITSQSDALPEPHRVPASNDAVAYILPPAGTAYVQVVTIGPGDFTVDIAPSPVAWKRRSGWAPCDTSSVALALPLDPAVQHQLAFQGAFVGLRYWTTGTHGQNDTRRLWCYTSSREDQGNVGDVAPLIGLGRAITLSAVITMALGVPIGVAIVLAVRQRRAKKITRAWLHEQWRRLRWVEGHIQLPDEPISEPVD